MNENEVKEVVIHGRWRVVLISVLSSGIVALSISWMAEREADNDQVDGYRKNCHRIQTGFTTVTEIATDASKNMPTKKLQEKWIDYSNRFNSIIPPQAPTCVEQFPKRTILPFIGG